jgi:membrane complex biogenesis BtpA family protein
MIHLLPLPGSPRWSGPLDEVIRTAESDLGALVGGGAAGAIVENFGDAPFYPDHVPPATIAAMTAVLQRLVRLRPSGFLLGVNVLRNDAAAALSIASVVGAEFLRVNVHTGAAIADQGLLIGRAHETLRLRRELNAPVSILADVCVKHATPLGGRSIEEEARDVWERGLADGLLVTGSRTGAGVDPGMLARVRSAVPQALLLAASGVDPACAGDLARHCDGFIAGTWLKKDGQVQSPIDVERVKALRAALEASRA